MSTVDAIGSRVRHERQARGMSLRKVAEALGVSASLISQIETGKTQPSVATLYGLATLLEVSVDDLLGLRSKGGSTVLHNSRSHVVQRGADNSIIDMENGVRWERLAMGPDGPADALLVTYQPGASSSLEGKMMRHAGAEYAYILSGEITLQLEFDTHQLRPGDSLHFASSRPHMYSNQGTVPAVGVWLVVGRRDAGAHGASDDQFRQESEVLSAVDVLQRLDSRAPDRRTTSTD